MISQEKKDLVVSNFKKCWNKKQAFILSNLTKNERIEAIEDKDFMTQLDSLISAERASDLKVYDDLLVELQTTDIIKSAPTIIKILENKDKLLYQQLDTNSDDENCMNIVFMSCSKEDYKSAETVEVGEGSGSLSSNFGREDDESFEAQQKKKVKKMIKEKDKNNGNS